MDTLCSDDPGFRERFVGAYLFKAPCLIRPGGPGYGLAADDWLAVLRHALRDAPAGRPGDARLYLDGALQPGTDAEFTPAAGETVATHLDRVTGGGTREVCHLLSHLQRWLPGFMGPVERWIGRFGSAVDCDALQLDSALFIGQYGSTPLRVHKDNACTFKTVVSGRKRLLAWPLAHFEPGTGEREARLLKTVDWRDHRATAIDIEVQAGETVYFPFPMWHVLTSDNRPHCSVSLSFVPLSAGARISTREHRHVSLRWAGR